MRIEGVFRTQSNTYDEAFFAKIVNSSTLDQFAKIVNDLMFDLVLNTPLKRVY